MTITAISADGAVHEFPDGTDTAVIGKVMKDYASRHQSDAGPSSFGDNLVAGVGNTMRGLGATLSDVGLPSAGNALSNAAPALPAGYKSPDVAGDLKRGNWSAIPGDVAHSVAEGAPDIATTLGLDAIPGVGPVAGAAYQAARNYGPIVNARATANGEAAPSLADKIEAIPATAATAALGAVMPGVGSKTIGNAAARELANIGITGAASAGIDQATQIGSTIGTDQGVSDDPYQSAAAALTGAATRGVMRGVAGAKEGVKSASDLAQASTLEPLSSPAQAASVIRVKNAVQAVSDATPTSQPLTALYNTVKADLVTNLTLLSRRLLDSGTIDNDQFRSFTALVNKQALPHNNTITEDTNSLFQQINDWNAPDDLKQQAQDGVRDLNTASTQSFQNRTTGPFQKLGNVAGQVGAIGGAAMSGNIPGVIGAVMGHGLAGKVGGAAGSLVDRILGTNTPTNELQAINAARMLRGVGIDPTTLPTATANVRSAQGLVPQPAPQAPQPDPAQARMQARGLNLSEQAGAWLERQLIAKAAAQSAARQQAIQTANRQDVGMQAQRTLDQNAFRNAVALQASTLTPSLQTSVGDTANEAAMARAAANAQSVQNLATGAAGSAVTGTPPGATPVPVNTPIRLPPAPQAPPGLRVDTPATVAAALADADLESGGTPPASGAQNQALQGASTGPLANPSPAPAGPPAGSPQAVSGGLDAPATLGLPWERYVANGNAGITRQQVQDAVRAVHAPAQAQALLAHNGGADPAILQPVQQHLGTLVQARARAAMQRQGFAVDRSEQARVNAREYQASARAAADAATARGRPEVARAILDIAQGAKTPTDKRAKATAYTLTDPSMLGEFPAWLLNHGHKG